MGTKTPEAEKKGEVSTEDVRMKQITVRPATGMSWARVRYQQPSNFVSIQSDYGNWSYGGWQAIGSQPLPSFLAGLNASYAGGKMLGGAISVLDLDGTIAAIKDEIIRRRCEAGSGAETDDEFERRRFREKSQAGLHGSGTFPGLMPEWFAWTADRAREEWKLAETIDSDYELNRWFETTSLEDPWATAPVQTMDYSWRNFWDRLWVPYIQPELKRLGQEEAPA